MATKSQNQKLGGKPSLKTYEPSIPPTFPKQKILTPDRENGKIKGTR